MCPYVMKEEPKTKLQLETKNKDKKTKKQKTKNKKHTSSKTTQIATFFFLIICSLFFELEEDIDENEESAEKV